MTPVTCSLLDMRPLEVILRRVLVRRASPTDKLRSR
jgi:hypothetical protein